MEKSPNPPVLLFVPGLATFDGNTAARVARVIASSLSRLSARSYSIDRDSGDAGEKALIYDRDDKPVLQVIGVDYRTRLAETLNAKDAHGWKLLRSGRFAILGIHRLLAARTHSKTGRQRLFLLAGLMLVLLMIGAFGLLALAALAAIGVDGLSRFAPSEDSNQLAWGAGLAFAAGALNWLRNRILVGGQRVKELVQYLERDREAASVALALDVEIARLLEQKEPPREIHILAYGFGCIVALDALFPRLPRPRGKDLLADAIKSFVTIGCPGDIVRQFYPYYFENRIARIESRKWINLFHPGDLLGSNFLDNDDSSDIVDGHVIVRDSAGGQIKKKIVDGRVIVHNHNRDRTKLETVDGETVGGRLITVCGIGDVYPKSSLAVGCEGLSLNTWLSGDIRIRYWDQAHRANLLEPVIDTWFSLDRPEEGGASAEKTGAVDGNPADAAGPAGAAAGGQADLATAVRTPGSAERAVDRGADRPTAGGEDRSAERAAA